MLLRSWALGLGGDSSKSSLPSLGGVSETDFSEAGMSCVVVLLGGGFELDFGLAAVNYFSCACTSFISSIVRAASFSPGPNVISADWDAGFVCPTARSGRGARPLAKPIRPCALLLGDEGRD